MYLKRTGRMVVAAGPNKVGNRVKLTPQVTELHVISVSAASGDVGASCELTVLPTGLNIHHLTNLLSAFKKLGGIGMSSLWLKSLSIY